MLMEMGFKKRVFFIHQALYAGSPNSTIITILLENSDVELYHMIAVDWGPIHLNFHMPIVQSGLSAYEA